MPGILHAPRSTQKSVISAHWVVSEPGPKLHLFASLSDPLQYHCVNASGLLRSRCQDRIRRGEKRRRQAGRESSDLDTSSAPVEEGIGGRLGRKSLGLQPSFKKVQPD